MEGPRNQPVQDITQRRMKFPRTRRERFLVDGRLYDVALSLPPETDGQLNGFDPLQGATFGPGPVPMDPYPMPPQPLQQHSVTWADQDTSSGDGSTYESTTDEEGSKHSSPKAPEGSNNNKMGALTGMALPSGRVPEDATPSNGEPRNWIQIAKTEDDSDGPPVLGPPGRTPPPVRKNFKFPEELDDDTDDVFYDETVPEVVFNEDAHHPAYGNYIPGQYQHTLNYLYGLETIREVDESMLNSQETFKEKASSWDIFVISLSLLGYLVNVGSDIWLAYQYFHLGHYVWFALTLAFVMLPSLAMTIFSLILYVQDHKVLKDNVSKTRWFFRSIFLILLIAPAMRIIDTLHYGLKSRRTGDWRMRRKNYERMQDEDTDSCLVRLFETFLENAPQLVLQLYVVVRLGNAEGSFLVAIQVLGLIMSLTTMAWSLVSFQASLRASLSDKAVMTWAGKFCMFMWRLLTISARVVALAMFASYFEVYIFAVIGGHFMIMFLWMTQQKTSYCKMEVKEEDGKTHVHHSMCLEFCFRVMGAFVHIFCFFNLLEGHTRLRCLVFYAVMYVENTVLILTWNILASTIGYGGWYQLPAVAIVMAGFFVGLLFQITYYLWCHPNRSSLYHRHRRIRLCVPCSELSLFHETRGPNEDERAERKPVFENKGREMQPAFVRPEPPRSDFGLSAVSSVGPIIPMETSTPAPSTVGVSPPHKVIVAESRTPNQLPPGASPEAAGLEGTPSPAVNTPVPEPRTEDRPRPVPAPRQPRPTTPGREVEAQRSRPTTPARELEAISRSRPTTPARELEIRGEYEPKSPQPPESGEKVETEV